MLEVIIVTIFIATFFNIFFKRYQVPTIIWYIITWICISFLFGIDNAWTNEDLKLIAEFWIVFLMFTIWLEFSLKNLLKMKKYVFTYWWLQFFISAFVFLFFSYFVFWIDIKTSIIVSSWLSLSSTAIVLKILNDNKEINKKYWQKALGILLFQDLIVIPILLLISIFSQEEANIGYLLFEALINSITLVVILGLTWKYLLDIFLRKVYKINSNEVFMGSVLLIVMGASYFAHYLGLSYSIGAFIAGIMIAETHFKYKIESGLIPFRDLLLGIFFITVWMQLDFDIISKNYWTIALVLFWVIFLKIFILFTILIFRTQKSTALKTALSLFQIWEFAIVIFQLAKEYSLIDSTLVQILVVVIILTMILTPFILRYIYVIVWFFLRKKFSEFTNIKDLENHIILIWYGRVGRMVSDFLDENKEEHIIIESDLNCFLSAKKDGKRVILWDAFDDNILETTSILRASFVIISLWFSYNVVPVVQKISKMIEKEKIIVKVSKYSEKEQLLELDIPHIIVETEKTAITILDYINELSKSDW